MICPTCKSENCQVISLTTSSGKDFSASKGCCGAVLLGPIGLLCGACGKGRQINSSSYWVCRNCGRKWQI